MLRKEVLIIVGTRPNFIKVTQFKKEAKHYPHLNIKIAHTGQHFDTKMADVFFEQFNLIPDVFFNVKPASANTQMAEIMVKLEAEINDKKPDLIIVVGDVNSTFAAALTANKMGIKIAHLESGLRSNDKTMPEEHNRVLTDAITDYFFVTEQSGYDNLIAENKKKENIFFVGNTMIDTLVAFQSEIDTSDILNNLNLSAKNYILMTMHRPATVDDVEGLKKLSTLIKKVSTDLKIVFPIHPRTLKNIDAFNLGENFRGNKNLILTEPLDYFSFQKLVKEAKLILTDSGGIQEESTFLQVPCLTLRPNTERPITVTIGSNELVPFEIETIINKVNQIKKEEYKLGNIPPLWDGKTTSRILAELDKLLA
jgi:UDP-N-acetylglucosamine 2-epimerase (non-hydrolysing)